MLAALVSDEQVLLEARCNLGGLALMPAWGRAWLTSRRILWKQGEPSWFFGPFYGGPRTVEIAIDSMDKIQASVDNWSAVLLIWSQQRWHYLRLNHGWNVFGSRDVVEEWRWRIEEIQRVRMYRTEPQ